MNRIGISPEPTLVVGALGLLFIALHALTVPTEVNSGLGYDGILYARMVETLRTGASTDIWGPYAYRVLPAAIVAWSGLEVRQGFYALNVAATLASGLVLLALFRHAGMATRARLQAVIWWALLPFALRFVVHDPVLVDGIGFLFVAALLYAVMTGRLVAFAVLLTLGVLTRENLIILAPLLFLRALPAKRQAFAALCATIPAFAALAAIHAWPPFPVNPISPSTAEIVGDEARRIMTNESDEAFRLLVSPLLALGVILAVALAHPMRLARVFAREPGWSYFATATIVTATIGGGDHDRYLLVLVPLLLIAIARVSPTVWHGGLALALLAAHVASTRALVPVGPSGSEHFAYMTQTAPIAVLTRNVLVLAVLVVVVVIVVRVSDAGLRGSVRE